MLMKVMVMVTMMVMNVMIMLIVMINDGDDAWDLHQGGRQNKLDN